jgi:hypothetical protein
MSDPWNRCDVCGKFIAMKHFDEYGGAVRRMITPDSEHSRETWETLCTKHSVGGDLAQSAAT